MVRIESVRFDASGNAAVAVSGGIVFFIPRNRLSELASALDTSRNIQESDQSTARRRIGMLAENSTELETGDPLYEAIARIDEETRARTQAVALIARAEQCRAGLSSKLIRKGFSRGAVETVLDFLESEAILDDSRYATLWASTRLARKPAGPAVIYAGLRSRGISHEDARTAVASVDFSDILERLGRSVLAREGSDAARNMLRKEGFDSRMISEFLEAID